MGIMEHARAMEPKEEFDRIVQAIGAVVVEVDLYWFSRKWREGAFR